MIQSSAIPDQPRSQAFQIHLRHLGGPTALAHLSIETVEEKMIYIRADQ